MPQYLNERRNGNLFRIERGQNHIRIVDTHCNDKTMRRVRSIIGDEDFRIIKLLITDNDNGSETLSNRTDNVSINDLTVTMNKLLKQHDSIALNVLFSNKTRLDCKGLDAYL